LHGRHSAQRRGGATPPRGEGRGSGDERQAGRLGDGSADRAHARPACARAAGLWGRQTRCRAAERPSSARASPQQPPPVSAFGNGCAVAHSDVRSVIGSSVMFDSAGFGCFVFRTRY
jgi:hypothetical protein